MKPIRTAILTALYTCLAFLHASCVREDTGDCVQYQVHVRVVDAAGNDLTESGVLEKSEVYLFGENGFVRMVPANGFLRHVVSVSGVLPLSVFPA